MLLVLGFKGREWALRNKKWDSVEHFQTVQRKWSFWGLVIYLGPLFLGLIAAIALPAFYFVVFLLLIRKLLVFM
tara:strand:+ start:246 stop:467 length:222 start_codon:yes stop_codon:yes gene_type:complete